MFAISGPGIGRLTDVTVQFEIYYSSEWSSTVLVWLLRVEY